MAQRIAGVANLKVDGVQLALRGNFTVSPSAVERTMLAGQDGVHGYQELPRVPYIEGDISTVPGLLLASLEAETDVTVVAQLANGMQYSLTGGTCKAGFENNTRDGQVKVRWEGLACQEMTY
jgi:Phage tail tube protein